MRTNKLGNTGLYVSELCLGTMTFGGDEGMWGKIGRVEQQGVNDLVKTALDAGINFIDTANVYSRGLSETMTGEALRSLGIARDQVVVATKFMGPMGEGPNERGASRYHVMHSVEQSLKRLGTGHIDLYQVHGFDAATPMEETLRALDALVERGDVRYIGVSNWAAWQIVKALGISAKEGLARFESLQAYYTIAGRDLERDIVPMLASEKLGLMVWSPLAGGFLSGKYTREGEGDPNGRRVAFDFPPVDKEKGFDIIDVMRGLAEARGVSVAQIALSWLLHQPAVTSVIVGAKRVDQLADNIAATRVELDGEALRALDEVSRLAPEYPGWMLERQGEYREAQLNQPARTMLAKG